MTRQSNIPVTELTFESIFHDYGKGLYAFLFRMSGNQHDAEDLTQETFLSVMNKLPTFNGDSSLKTWIYSIATNKFRDALRYGKIRDHDALSGNEPAHSRSPLSDLMVKECGEQVKAAFYGLNEQYRAAFALVRFEGMSYKEAALVLGTTLDTVRMRVHRAHLLLAELLKEAQR
jgi:RNA polymerase sigma-70 factor (ECF subfamily)